MLKLRNIIVPVFLICCMAAALISCSSTKEAPATVWVNKEKMQGKSFQYIYIIVQTKDIQARQIIESDLANEALAKGYKVVKSIDAIPPDLNNPQIPAKDEIVKSVKASGCDAVFAASLLKKEEAVRYTAGTNSYTPVSYYAWSGTFGSYYDHWYSTVSTLGYYTKDKEYFIQSNLFDVSSQELMISIQSKLYNPESIGDFSKVYVKDVVRQLNKAGLKK
jgi:hypothetical protein